MTRTTAPGGPMRVVDRPILVGSPDTPLSTPYDLTLSVAAKSQADPGTSR
ncbi:hypothetical protein [Micromonospora orduensis]